MTAIELFGRWAKQLEEAEAERHHVKLPNARKLLARRLKTRPGTLENLMRGRLRSVSVELADKIRGAIEHDLRRQIQALERELEIAARGGSALGEPALRKVERALDEARGYLADGQQHLAK